MTKQRQQQNLPPSRDGGYTIIESLVAMIVVSVLMIAIAPVMAFSVATRVQARRMELATQAARAYIDGLRTGAIKPLIDNKDTSSPPDSAPLPAFANLYCVDLDADGDCTKNSNKDLLIQGAWRNPTDPTDPTKTGYELTVRVYRGDAFASTAGTLKKEQQSVANSALGDPKAPLVVMKTQIPPTTEGGPSAYRSLCTRLKGDATKCQN